MEKYLISVEVDDETLLKIIKRKINLNDLMKNAVDEEMKKFQENVKEEMKDSIKELNEFVEKNGKFNPND